MRDLSIKPLLRPEPQYERERVCLITMPDSYDVAAYLRQCMHADEAANHANRGRGDVTWRSIITYPQLRGVRDVTRVYIAWRGRVRAWHLADRVRTLSLSDLSSMHPTLASRMAVGAPYMWVYAEPVSLPHNEIPPVVETKALRYGVLSRPLPHLVSVSLMLDGSLAPTVSYPGGEVIEWEP